MHRLLLFFNAHMDIVFLVYGAAFLILGIAILVQPKRTSTFKFAPQLWLLAGFGLFHGANEWLDLLKLLHGPTTFLKVTSLCFLITSYGLLFEFGRRLVKMSTRGNTAIVTTLSPGIYLPIVGVLLVTGLTSEYPWINLDILFRYFFGFSSALLTGYGLFLYYQYEKQRIGTLKLRTNFVWAAAIFVTYGVLSGLVVQKADYFPANWLNYDSFMEYVHLPVQIARAITAET